MAHHFRMVKSSSMDPRPLKIAEHRHYTYFAWSQRSSFFHVPSVNLFLWWYRLLSRQCALKNLQADPGRIAYFDYRYLTLTLENYLLYCTPAELLALIPAHLIFSRYWLVLIVYGVDRLNVTDIVKHWKILEEVRRPRYYAKLMGLRDSVTW